MDKYAIHFKPENYPARKLDYQWQISGLLGENGRVLFISDLIPVAFVMLDPNGAGKTVRRLEILVDFIERIEVSPVYSAL